MIHLKLWYFQVRFFWGYIILLEGGAGTGALTQEPVVAGTNQTHNYLLYLIVNVI